MLNPVFSTKHLREMTPLFFEIIHKVSLSGLPVVLHSYKSFQTRDAIMQRVDAGPKDGVELDMLGWMGRTTLEVLGQAGLGYSFDPLTEDRMDEFANAVKEFL